MKHTKAFYCARLFCLIFLTIHILKPIIAQQTVVMGDFENQELALYELNGDKLAVLDVINSPR
ncbi:MAG TPA: hypothetical protein VJ917_06930, partial [Saprospiraceae bacterium]|nr:hypothetical protein [Saprospiraceae bacterium]